MDRMSGCSPEGTGLLDLPPREPNDNMGVSGAGGHGRRPHIRRWSPRFRMMMVVAGEVPVPCDEEGGRAKPLAATSDDARLGDGGLQVQPGDGLRCLVVTRSRKGQRRVDSIESSCRRTLLQNQCTLYRKARDFRPQMVGKYAHQYLTSLLRP